MRKTIISVLSVLALCLTLTVTASAASDTHTVVSGDTMWKIAIRYEVGIRELIDANPQIANPSLIYPGQVLSIPTLQPRVLSYEAQVVELVNEIRTERGLAPLTANWELSRVARFKAQDMRENNYFSHTSPVYGSPFQMMRDFGLTYRRAGENIAKGYATPKAVVDAWMNSPSHRENILSPSFTVIGVGYEPQGNHWSQMFIG